MERRRPSELGLGAALASLLLLLASRKMIDLVRRRVFGCSIVVVVVVCRPSSVLWRSAGALTGRPELWLSL